MHYYLTAWRGTGVPVTDPFVPDLLPVGSLPAYDVVDLRPDPTVAAGWAVVAVVTQPASVPTSATYLGDGSFAALPTNIKNRLRNNLGLASLAASTVPEILGEILTLHAATTATLCPPTPPLLRDTAFGRFRRYEVHLGEVHWIREEPI